MKDTDLMNSMMGSKCRLISVIGGLFAIIGSILNMMTVSSSDGKQTIDVSVLDGIGFSDVVGKITVACIVLAILAVILNSLKAGLILASASSLFVAADMISTALIGRGFYGSGSKLSIGLGGFIMLAGCIFMQTALLKGMLAAPAASAEDTSEADEAASQSAAAPAEKE